MLRFRGALKRSSIETYAQAGALPHSAHRQISIGSTKKLIRCLASCTIIGTPLVTFAVNAAASASICFTASPAKPSEYRQQNPLQLG